VIELTDWLAAELARRASLVAPREACGLISQADPAQGLPEGGIALWAAHNVASDPEHAFEIDPVHLLKITGQIEARRETLAGVYHSHPMGLAAPSPTDLETAGHWPGLTWVIIGAKACPRCTEGECGECSEGDVPDFWIGVLS
jgi:desampylase